MADEHARSSRARYRAFREDYRHHRLDDGAPDAGPPKPAADTTDVAVSAAAGKTATDGKAVRRQYLREYMRWLWPYRVAVLAFGVLALVTAGLQMVEPLFMRFIVDRVLLVPDLDTPTKLSRL